MRSQNIKFIFDEKGNKTNALLSIKEFQNLLEKLDSLRELAVFYERTSKKFKPIPYETIRKELFGKEIYKGC